MNEFEVCSENILRNSYFREYSLWFRKSDNGWIFPFQHYYVKYEIERRSVEWFDFILINYNLYTITKKKIRILTKDEMFIEQLKDEYATVYKISGRRFRAWYG